MLSSLKLHDNSIYRFVKPIYKTNVKYNLNKKEIIRFLKIKKVKDIAKHYGCSKSNVYVFCKKNNIKIPKLDLVGTRWEMLKVIAKSDSRGKSGRQSQYWKCKCDCGKIIELATKDINLKNRISCGCWIKSKEYREKHWSWCGCGDIHGKWWGNIKRGAKKRNHKFTISIEYAWNLFLKQRKKCALTGLDLKFGSNMKEIEKGVTTASLDRINSNLGYIKGNVHWVHKDINFMKQDFVLDHFVSMCKLVTNNMSV